MGSYYQLYISTLRQTCTCECSRDTAMQLLTSGNTTFTGGQFGKYNLSYGHPGINTSNVTYTKNGNNYTWFCGRKLVVLSTTNAAFIDFTENWLASMRRIGPLPYIIIIAEDATTYHHLANISDIHVARAPNYSTNKSLRYGTREYTKFVNKRAQYILELLRQGFDVLFADVDMVWMQDPFPYIKKDLDNFDLCGQLDVRNVMAISTGFAYYKSNTTTIQLVEIWIETMSRRPTQDDNPILIELIRQGKVKDLKVTYLDPFEFLGGAEYFNDTWREKYIKRLNPVVIHNTYIKGHDTKVERFKRLGLWYI